jgi:uncharacterized membrane protein
LIDANRETPVRRSLRVAESRRATVSFLAAVAAVATYVAWSGRALPAYVASHFGGDGTANGYMPRSAYVVFMLVVSISLPLVIFASARVLPLLPTSLLNLPHRDYWLAPERRAQTYAYLEDHTARFATMLALFLGFVHWRVVAANASRPATLEPVVFVGGLAVFLVSLVVWTALLAAHFRRDASKPKPRRPT